MPSCRKVTYVVGPRSCRNLCSGRTTKRVTLGVFQLQKNSENCYREFPFGKRAFHLSQVPFVHRTLSVASLNLPRIFKMEANEAHQMLFLCEMWEVSIEEESLINSEDDAVDIFSATSTFMRRNLQRTEGYFEHVLPGYSLDGFKSHFRMTRHSGRSV